MKQIPLTKGYVALVDDEDFEYLSKFKWTVKIGRRTVYAVRHLEIPMHRVVIQVDDDKVVDHINRDGLDNRKKNLRTCTHLENRRNSTGKIGGTSKYKGVTWNKQHKKWKARVHINRKEIFLGYFKNEEDAAKAYDIKAKEMFGEYAFLNFDKHEK